MKICLHKFFGDCPHCYPDTDRKHHPNNLDCSRYKAIEVTIFEPKEKEYEFKPAPQMPEKQRWQEHQAELCYG